MNTENTVLMEKGREALKGNWGLMIGACIIYALIGRGFPAINLVLSGPMSSGISTLSLKYARKENPQLSDLFDGFNNFWNTLVAFLLTGLYIILWSLLLIIPGIIAAISYSQTFFIMAEDKNIDPFDAINKSTKMMEGHKARYFGLCMRFFGWAILCLFTLGIGFFWLIPWMQVTFAYFYEDINRDI